jgi:hypothetical protein
VNGFPLTLAILLYTCRASLYIPLLISHLGDSGINIIEIRLKIAIANPITSNINHPLEMYLKYIAQNVADKATKNSAIEVT